MKIKKVVKQLRKSINKNLKQTDFFVNKLTDSTWHTISYDFYIDSEGVQINNGKITEWKSLL
jgi:hypothetical protein